MAPPRRFDSLGLFLALNGIFGGIGVLVLIIGLVVGQSELTWLGGGFLVLVVVFLIPLFAFVEVIDRRGRPGRTLAFAPAPVGVPFELHFTTEAGRYHGFWVNWDIDWDLRPRPHGFIVDFQLAVDGEIFAPKRYYQSFAQPRNVTKSAGARVGTLTGMDAPDGFDPGLRELDLELKSVNHPGTGWRGKLRVYACFAELDLAPGRSATIRGTIRPTDDATIHRFEAEAFVALAP